MKNRNRHDDDEDDLPLYISAVIISVIFALLVVFAEPWVLGFAS